MLKTFAKVGLKIDYRDRISLASFFIIKGKDDYSNKRKIPSLKTIAVIVCFSTLIVLWKVRRVYESSEKDSAEIGRRVS